MNTSNIKSLGVAVVLASALGGLAGCELYFGDHSSSGDSWAYCGSDGYYQCDGNDVCTKTSSTCPSDPTGYTCGSNTDCAAGCYCSGGTCTEGGFCGSDGDCGTGFTCDPTRSSCEPVPGCGSDADCGSGSVCTNGTCTTSCTCTTDQQAIDQGFGWCDTSRDTCETGTDPAGDCNDAVTCNEKPPVCMEHQVPLVLNGCYTGDCRDITACEGAPACGERQFSDDCAADSQCEVVSVGHDCTKPDGTSCTAGDTDCTCASFTFSACDDKTSTNVIPATGTNGQSHLVSATH
jgi:Cys-rich repeat protein|nr:hypothetical protein [Kofleriaceae bacterium]